MICSCLVYGRISAWLFSVIWFEAPNSINHTEWKMQIEKAVWLHQLVMPIKMKTEVTEHLSCLESIQGSSSWHFKRKTHAQLDGFGHVDKSDDVLDVASLIILSRRSLSAF
eukprot:TRINITY_DN37628_c0_g1_i3.p1 TRINITY_DN37628_c0_g1~~TRINITY_DN37628_c0_g1_i3.p1  ORF type:complete len:111 (-),score=14.76 TRINITY_DN37628_c0_g1_i3:1264-1596(-)